MRRSRMKMLGAMPSWTRPSRFGPRRARWCRWHGCSSNPELAGSCSANLLTIGQPGSDSEERAATVVRTTCRQGHTGQHEAAGWRSPFWRFLCQFRSPPSGCTEPLSELWVCGENRATASAALRRAIVGKTRCAGGWGVHRASSCVQLRHPEALSLAGWAEKWRRGDT